MITSGKDTHMFDGRLTVHYMEHVLGPAIRRRRHELGLPSTSKVLILADAFTGNKNKEYFSCRQDWARRLEAVVLGADDDADVQTPGGWSAYGQPNDAWHCHMHKIRQAYERVCTDKAFSILHRKALDDLDIDTNEMPGLTTSQAIHADVWAARAIQKAGDGKILRWAWISRGYVTREQCMEWRGEEIRDETAQRLLQPFMRLDEVPMMQPSVVPWAEYQTPAEGECRRIWATFDQDQWLKVPEYTYSAIEDAISTYVFRRNHWAEVHVKKKKLTQKQQSSFDIFLSTIDKEFVFNTSTKVQVRRPAQALRRTLLRDCCAMVINLESPYTVQVRGSV